MIVVKVDRCLGCRSCELACAVEHSRSRTLVEAIHEDPCPRARMAVRQERRYAVPLQCRHCGKAPCIQVCPTKALHRANRESPVVVDQELCNGCRQCVEACPFGVIWIDEDNQTVLKCDLCFERLERGELPACVTACPSRALEFKAPAEAPEEKQCADLVTIEPAIDAEKCTGCGACLKKCPVDAIQGAKKKAHVIDSNRCIECGVCEDTCRFEAVKIR